MPRLLFGLLTDILHMQDSAVLDAVLRIAGLLQTLCFA